MRVVFALTVLLQFSCWWIICIIIILLKKKIKFDLKNEKNRTEETNDE